MTKIDLAAGETVTCTFVNQQLSTIVVEKTADPATSEQGFSSVAAGATTSLLKGGESETFEDLVPGDGYSVSESIPDGWRQVSATCSDGSPVSNIDLAAGETVTCTFVNQQLATLIVREVGQSGVRRPVVHVHPLAGAPTSP